MSQSPWIRASGWWYASGSTAPKPSGRSGIDGYPTLRLNPGQAKLTPDQEVEALHFAEAYIRAQLSTEPADEAGRLHDTTGKCMEYHDGWGFWAWHGVQVSENVILAPEALTRDDFLTERSLEVRRIIQERMGSRFVHELGGQVIESGPRGTLYEVALPGDDPERVAHYVQVQDASTARQYFLRVPPTIQTAAEAVAWSFQMSNEEYGPAQET